MPAFPLPKVARRALLAGGALAIAAFSFTALSGSAATAASSAPSAASTAASGSDSAKVPGPVPVTVDPRTTAYLVLDLTSAVCTPSPSCVASLPAAASLLARARAAGALVVYSKTVHPGDAVLPQVAPQPGDPLVAANPDKFLGTDLGQILTAHGIKTVVLVGTKSNGAILYTSLEASARGFTVVVAEDGVSADSPYIMRYSLFQLLNQPGFTNPTNTPDLATGVTLSTTGQVTFGS